MNRKVHHTTELNEPPCAICGEPFLMYWWDASEQNGKSDQTSRHEGKKVHFLCVPGAKTLHQLNEERKLAAKK